MPVPPKKKLSRFRYGITGMVAGLVTGTHLNGIKVMVLDNREEAATGRLVVEVVEIMDDDDFGDDGSNVRKGVALGASFKIKPENLTRCCATGGCTRLTEVEEEGCLWTCSGCMCTCYCGIEHKNVDWLAKHRDLCAVKMVRGAKFQTLEPLPSLDPLAFFAALAEAMVKPRGRAAPSSAHVLSSALKLLPKGSDQATACQQLARLMVAHPTEKLFLIALGIVTGLGRDDDVNEAMGRGGVCEAVVAGVHKNLSNASIVQAGLFAVAILGANDVNEVKLEGAGAVELVLSSLRTHAGGQDDVARWGLGAMYSLCNTNTNNARKFGSLGGCEELMKTFAAYSTNVDVAVEGCRAIQVTSAMNLVNSTKLGDLGACEVVVSSLRAFRSHADLVETAIKAIHNLVPENLANNIRLCQAGAPGAIVEAMAIHASSALIAQRGVDVLCNLACSGTGTRDGRSPPAGPAKPWWRRLRGTAATSP